MPIKTFRNDSLFLWYKQKTKPENNNHPLLSTYYMVYTIEKLSIGLLLIIWILLFINYYKNTDL